MSEMYCIDLGPPPEGGRKHNQTEPSKEGGERWAQNSACSTLAFKNVCDDPALFVFRLQGGLSRVVLDGEEVLYTLRTTPEAPEEHSDEPKCAAVVCTFVRLLYHGTLPSIADLRTF